MSKWKLRTEGCATPIAIDLESGMCVGHSDVADFFVDQHNADCDTYESEIVALRAEVDELRRRLDAVVAMLEVPTESRKKDGWLAYCENCWWRGEAENANWGTDPDSDGYCPECGYEILEMGGDWSREESIHARAAAIAEGREP